jgi:hypothetical protein
MLVEGSFWENLKNKLKRRGPLSLAEARRGGDGGGDRLKCGPGELVDYAASWEDDDGRGASSSQA